MDDRDAAGEWRRSQFELGPQNDYTLRGAPSGSPNALSHLSEGPEYLINNVHLFEAEQDYALDAQRQDLVEEEESQYPSTHELAINSDMYLPLARASEEQPCCYRPVRTVANAPAYDEDEDVRAHLSYLEQPEKSLSMVPLLFAIDQTAPELRAGSTICTPSTSGYLEPSPEGKHNGTNSIALIQSRPVMQSASCPCCETSTRSEISSAPVIYLPSGSSQAAQAPSKVGVPFQRQLPDCRWRCCSSMSVAINPQAALMGPGRAELGCWSSGGQASRMVDSRWAPRPREFHVWNPNQLTSLPNSPLGDDLGRHQQQQRATSSDHYHGRNPHQRASSQQRYSAHSKDYHSRDDQSVEDESDNGLPLVPIQMKGRLPSLVAEQMKEQASNFVQYSPRKCLTKRSASSGQRQKPNLKVRRTLRVKIRKSKPILGIAIEGGFNVSGQLLPRIVCVHEDGAAYQCGKIRASDLILEVNGISTVNMTHDDIAETIANAYYQDPRSHIEFLIGESVLV